MEPEAIFIASSNNLENIATQFNALTFPDGEKKLLVRSLSVMLYTFFEVFIKSELATLKDVYKKIDAIDEHDFNGTLIAAFLAEKVKIVNVITSNFGQPKAAEMYRTKMTQTNAITILNQWFLDKKINGKAFADSDLCDYSIISQKIMDLNKILSGHLFEKDILNNIYVGQNANLFLMSSNQQTSAFAILNSFCENIRQPVVHEFEVQANYELSFLQLIEKAQEFRTIVSSLAEKFRIRESVLKTRYSV